MSDSLTVRCFANYPRVSRNEQLKLIDRSVTPYAMTLLQEQLDASDSVTVANERDGVWTAISSHTSTRQRIGGEQHYKRRIVVKFTPSGVPYLHCDCNFYIQRGVVCGDVLSLKCGHVVQSDIHPRFWTSLAPPTAAERIEWNVECHPTIDGVPGLSVALIARLRETAASASGHGGDDDGRRDGGRALGDGESRQSVDFDVDVSDAHSSAHTLVTVAEISKKKNRAGRYNLVQKHVLRLFGDLMGDMARQVPRDLSVCLSEWLPNKVFDLHQEFREYFAVKHADSGAGVVTRPNIRSNLRGSGTSAKAGMGTTKSKKRKPGH